MREEHYNERREQFDAFFARQARTNLKPGALKQVYDAFMHSSDRP